MRPRSVLLLCLATALVACAERPLTPDLVQGPFTWGATTVHGLERLWVGGLPDRATFEAARAAGVSVVVDLREAEERAADPDPLAEIATELGMAHYAIPFERYQPIRHTMMDGLDGVLGEHSREEIFVHCSSGNRAAGWLTAHLIEARGVDAETGVAIGRRAGITKDSIVEFIWHYVH